MEAKRLSNGPIVASPDGSGRTRSPQPSYSSRAVREALEHLASVDLVDLCNEAKIERCRAIRDLRSCGRYVLHVLNSCSHASLCAECSQRCDHCPICRTQIPKSGNRLRLRLYYECIEAGLISKRCDERFQEREDENQLNADVLRLYSLFDVALENNLTSLICHYVTDVCMDESAVSSDPVTAFLLDEVVVKDWCKRTFSNIVAELRGIYNLELKDMKSRLSLLLSYSVPLAGMSNVLEVLESSFKGSLSPQLHDLHHLHESISKTKQHMEIMTWCIRHEFLATLGSRYANYEQWRKFFRERKSAAIKRSWPDVMNLSTESGGQEGSLFIEDAVANLEIIEEGTNEMGEESELFSLQKSGGSLFLRAKVEGLSGCYPFENLRAAADMLFLYGSSDLVVAKRAIFLYYLYDRHWTLPDELWRNVVDDFAASFGVTRHLLLESLTFYLLDDPTDEALKEACHLLPEISGPTTHPKIAQVLLERGMPDTALMVLRWSGRDGGSQLISLPEAITAVRVRVECGLLTEAFTYQRTLCSKVRERKLKYEAAVDPSNAITGECRTWVEWMEILVTEICCLSIRRKLVDRMIELPWNSDEEKYLHKCLMDYATDDPSSIIGNLLVVFYLQRHRYSEAYQVDCELQRLEQEFALATSASQDVLSRMQVASHWRKELVEKCIELLPEVQQQQIKSEKLPDIAVTCEDAHMPEECDLRLEHRPIPYSSSIPLAVDSSVILNEVMTPSSKQSDLVNPIKLPVSSAKFAVGLGNTDWASVSGESLLLNTERGSKLLGRSLKNDPSTSGAFDFKPASPLQRFPRGSPKFRQKSWPQGNLSHHIFSVVEPNGFSDEVQRSSHLHSQSPMANSRSSPASHRGLLRSSKQDLHKTVSGKRVHSEADGVPWNAVSSDDLMDISWSGEKSLAVEDENQARALRWRSDETSDEEEEPHQQRFVGTTPYRSPVTAIRRSRFARR
ncbi:E3 ubiquitin-protein ligase HOS1 isoform X2 [Rhodamnia argentea]|uniref:E3 ubiquitin-protein ligase HOS1 isoform X2 n=1 Tax=Rhodamnia argentea TaxID=178133 RepID=A0A8B8MTC0_9MYRT|nr:E3 ubiquitin-protein ligase HOS1 isoform X2 [Rhodamnia argentea]